MGVSCACLANLHPHLPTVTLTSIRITLQFCTMALIASFLCHRCNRETDDVDRSLLEHAPSWMTAAHKSTKDRLRAALRKDGAAEGEWRSMAQTVQLFQLPGQTAHVRHSHHVYSMIDAALETKTNGTQSAQKKRSNTSHPSSH